MTGTKINGNEKIEKIKFITETPNTEYSIKVYKKSGGYETYSKTSELPGLITIDITDDIEVDKNTKIIISSEGEYIDKVSIFTSNIDMTSFVNFDKYNDKEFSENQIRLYSETKNIPSGSTLTYKMYNSENQEDTRASPLPPLRNSPGWACLRLRKDHLPKNRTSAERPYESCSRLL